MANKERGMAMEQIAKIISVINWNGRVGKTTLAYHLATGLQHLNIDELERQIGKRHFPRVLLIDADAQCNLSISCLTDTAFEQMVYHDKYPIYTLKDLLEEFLINKERDINVGDYILTESVRSRDNKFYTNVDLIPSHPDLIYTDMNFAVRSNTDVKNNNIYTFQVLDNILSRVKHYYDFIFIDCPPALNYITQNALYASDYYIIPTIPDKLSTSRILSIINKVSELNKTFSISSSGYLETKLIGIIPNSIKVSSEKQEDEQAAILDTLREIFDRQIFRNYLAYGDGISKAFTLGYPVFAFEHTHPDSEKQSKQLKNILRELLQKIASEALIR